MTESEKASLALAEEKLLLATQDIFYFDYGCAVFWGLTEQEEKAAITELVPFVEDPVSEGELGDSHDTILEYSASCGRDVNNSFFLQNPSRHTV